MRRKITQLVVFLMVVSNSLFAQQWAGSNTTTSSIYRDGSVGIGTSSPGQALDVRGNIYTNASLIVDGGDLILQRTTAAYGYIVRPNTSGFKNLGFATQGGGQLDNFQVFSNNLYLSGNVSIGTTNPGSFKLAVDGAIGAREVQVTLQSPFPDYVFDSTYQLRSLPNLAFYIRQNRHLPGIPSAAEIKKEGGIKLGELNIKLLEKIEEQTLYILELNKKLEEIYKKVKELEKENKH